MMRVDECVMLNDVWCIDEFMLYDAVMYAE